MGVPDKIVVGSLATKSVRSIAYTFARTAEHIVCPYILDGLGLIVSMHDVEGGHAVWVDVAKAEVVAAVRFCEASFDRSWAFRTLGNMWHNVTCDVLDRGTWVGATLTITANWCSARATFTVVEPLGPVHATRVAYNPLKEDCPVLGTLFASVSDDFREVDAHQYVVTDTGKAVHITGGGPWPMASAGYPPKDVEIIAGTRHILKDRALVVGNKWPAVVYIVHEE